MEFTRRIGRRESIFGSSRHRSIGGGGLNSSEIALHWSMTPRKAFLGGEHNFQLYSSGSCFNLGQDGQLVPSDFKCRQEACRHIYISPATARSEGRYSEE